MGGECIDLMNECIFVGVLVANVQSGARSYFCGSNLRTKPLALSADCRNHGSVKGARRCYFLTLSLSWGIRVSECRGPVILACTESSTPASEFIKQLI